MWWWLFDTMSLYETRKCNQALRARPYLCAIKCCGRGLGSNICILDLGEALCVEPLQRHALCSKTVCTESMSICSSHNFLIGAFQLTIPTTEHEASIVPDSRTPDCFIRIGQSCAIRCHLYKPRWVSVGLCVYVSVLGSSSNWPTSLFKHSYNSWFRVRHVDHHYTRRLQAMRGHYLQSQRPRPRCFARRGCIWSHLLWGLRGERVRPRLLLCH